MMKDVIEGKCGCGACMHVVNKRLGWSGWLIEDLHPTCLFSMVDGVNPVKVACCPWCHYRLDPDGFARRMVNKTVEEVREDIARLDAWMEDFGGNRGLIESTERNRGALRELKRLLPEEESDAD